MANLVLAGIVSFLLAALPGKPVIERLRRMNMRQNISADAPSEHAAKQGTPTMGGLLILAATAITAAGYAAIRWLGEHTRAGRVAFEGVVALVALMLAFGAIGFADDYLSAKRGKNLGLRAREKLAAQFVAAGLFVSWIAVTARPDTTVLRLTPGALGAATHANVDLGAWYYLAAVLFIAGLSNATNFTDGLDGLACGVAILICLAAGALLLNADHRSASWWLAVYPAALGGALLGFLWWNAHPARVFMGDTGALALGAGLAGLGILSRREIPIIVASLVCWAELVSVMIQVTVFKARRRRRGLEYARAHRVFLRTPLHHHFEELGWTETQVVARFWILGGLCAALAMLWISAPNG